MIKNIIKNAIIIYIKLALNKFNNMINLNEHHKKISQNSIYNFRILARINLIYYCSSLGMSLSPRYRVSFCIFIRVDSAYAMFIAPSFDIHFWSRPRASCVRFVSVKNAFEMLVAPSFAILLTPR